MVHISICYMVHKKSCEQLSQHNIKITLYYLFGLATSYCRLLGCICNTMFSEALRKKCHELRPIRVITRHITNNSNHGFVTIDQIFYPIQRTKNASTIKKTMFNLHCTFIHTHTHRHTTKVTYSSTTLSFSIGYPN